jgi:hypothetical protein
MSFVTEVINIGGGVPDFLGVSCCGKLFSVVVIPVSMSVVLRGAKKLREHWFWRQFDNCRC